MAVPSGMCAMVGVGSVLIPEPAHGIKTPQISVWSHMISLLDGRSKEKKVLVKDT